MLIPTLEKLVSFKTLSRDHKENRDALDWVQNELRDLPLHSERFSVNGFPALVATTQKTKSPKMWLQAHIDVVGGPENVFEIEYKDKRAYGRGVYDMKFAAACYIELLKDLKDKISDYDLGLMLTTDEELGGFHGTKVLLDKGYGGEVCILPDGGFNWALEEAAKGVLQLIVRSYGTSAHSSRPWEGRNAVEILAEFMNKLKNEFESEPCGDDKHLHNTLSFTVTTSGKNINNNKIPNYAETIADIRFMPDMNRKDVYNIIEKVKKDFTGIELDEYFFADSFKNDMKNGYYSALVESAKDLFDINIGTSLSHGSSDARYFAAKGITPLVIAPNGGGHHSEHEWIDTEDLERFYRVLKDFALKKGRVEKPVSRV
ncbi:MAG: M20 family metallopeptidase [Candidatus Spechtbacterales bacterium]|nr:M20 family metallopeptidase [Candidatus Spechtbacterales bacterium]